MVRKAAVAGAFYPSTEKEIRKMIRGFLDNAADLGLDNLRGIIVPHAGYIYSGPVAGIAYKQITKLAQKKYNIFILGPAHYKLTTASVGDFDFFETPLGKIEVNRKICSELLKNDAFEFDESAHLPEHSLEVQLPFLQMTFNEFNIIPILFGETRPEKIAELLLPHFKDKDNFFVVSSDLSHYLPYETARSTDKTSLAIIEKNDAGKQEHIDACGATGIKIAMTMAKQLGYGIKLLDYRNSGDTAGDKSAVVGYASLAITDNNK